MSRWIDYDAIDYRNDKLHDKSEEFLNGVIYMAQRIEEAPSIDLVRCGECELKRLCDSVGGVDDWNYCYWGKRKESEPTISKMEQVDKDIDVSVKEHGGLVEDK